MTRIPDPLAVRITRWNADPFALGSYSYLATGSTPTDRVTLGATVGSELFFAGEATDPDFPATVHGALCSGRRAAQAIMALDDPGRVVVIGAGFAGLACARELHEAGIAVSVVEARDRLGGRTWTDDGLGVPVDLGASWIHGPDGNPLTALADVLGVRRVATDYDDIVVRDESGAIVEFSSPDEEDIHDVIEKLDHDAVVSMRTVLDSLPDHWDPRDVETFAILAVENEYGADVHALDARALLEGESLGGDDVVFPGGYRQLVDYLADGLDIALGFVVEAISWGDEVSVRTTARTMAADHVVVTVPIGVLKARSIAFTPPLPEDKEAAIGALGSGLLDKVFLRFTERFWDDATIIVFRNRERGRFTVWFDQTAVTGQPTLLGFHAGSVAETVETLTDDEIVTEAMRALRTMYET